MNKKLVFVLISAIILTAFPKFSAFASDADSNYFDRASALASFGVFPEGINTQNESDAISKGEVLKAVLSIFTNGGSGAQTVYSDVTPGSEYYETAFTAYKLGIDLGLHGVLNPNGHITNEEFAKAMLVAGGYDALTQKYSASPNPYTMVCANLKIFDRNVSAADSVTYKTAVDSIYNLLLTRSPSELYKDDSVIYSYKGNDCVLKDRLGINCIEGIVSATQYADMKSGRELREGNIEIVSNDGTSVVLSEAYSFNKLLGYNAIAFYREANGINTLLYAIAKDNSEFFIDGDCFYGIDKDTLEIDYSSVKKSERINGAKDNKTKRISFDTDIIYNGQFASDSDEVFKILNNPGDMNIESVVLLDNDRDGKYEFLIADVYKSIGVKFVNNDHMTVTGTRGESLVLDENEKYINIHKGGVKADFSAIAVNTVLSVKEGLGQIPLADVEITDNTFLGSFYSLEADAAGNAVAYISVGEPSPRGDTYVGSYVGGVDNQLHIERYELDSGMYNHRDEIVLGNHLYRVMLDKKGRICALGMYTYGTGTNYASWFMSDYAINTYATIEFGIGIGVKKDGPLKDTFKIKMATIKKVLRSITVETYETSSDLKIENIPEEIVAEYGSDWKGYSEEALSKLFANRLFEIFFDSNGRLKKIVFPYKEKTEGRLSYFNEPGQKYIYKNGVLHSLTSNDILFEYSKQMCIQVPKAGTELGIDALYRVINFTSNSLAESGVYQINCYTFSKSSCMPEIMLMINDYSGVEVIDRVLKPNVGVVEKAYLTSTDGEPADAQEAYGLGGVASYGKSSIMASLYKKTYVTPSSAKAGDKETYGSLTTYFKAPLESLETYTDPIGPGDIVLYSTPFYNSLYSSVRYYSSALKLYDYGTKSVAYDQNGAVRGITNVILGTVSTIGDEFFSVAMDGKEASAENRVDVFYNGTTTQRAYVFVFTPGRYEDSGTLELAERVDIEEARLNNWRVVIAANQLAVIYKD